MSDDITMTVEGCAFPRAALAGNPSDGYFGKTIAFTFRNYKAEVSLTPANFFEFRSQYGYQVQFPGLREIAAYNPADAPDGMLQLLIATFRRFLTCNPGNDRAFEKRKFTCQAVSTIPKSVGLSGSSAIIIAFINALSGWYDVYFHPVVRSRIAWEVENIELGITAGWMDRVVQAFNQPLVMDFSRSLMELRGYGAYTPLDVSDLPPIYIAYDKKLAENSSIPHRSLKQLQKQQPEIVGQVMHRLAAIVDDFLNVLAEKDIPSMMALMNENFELRRRVMPVSEGNLRMVNLARSVGASAKFAGSGGAITGIYTDEEMYARLATLLGQHGITVLKPEIILA